MPREKPFRYATEIEKKKAKIARKKMIKESRKEGIRKFEIKS